VLFLFRNLLYKFAGFMYGRYGGDAFNIFLLILAMVISLVGQFFGLWWSLILYYALLFYAIFRMFSRNIPVRKKELYAFNKVWLPVKNFFTRTCGGWFKYQAEKFKYRSMYKYFDCPKCGRHLRAPKGRGKILVTCQQCKHEFQKKV